VDDSTNSKQLNQPVLWLGGGLSKKWNSKNPEERFVHTKQWGSYVAFLINQWMSKAAPSCKCKSAPEITEKPHFHAIYLLHLCAGMHKVSPFTWLLPHKRWIQAAHSQSFNVLTQLFFVLIHLFVHNTSRKYNTIQYNTIKHNTVKRLNS